MRIILVGGGTQLSYSIDAIEKQGLHTIVGIVDSKLEVNTELYKYKVIGRQENIKELILEFDVKGCVINLGDNWSRKRVFDEISSLAPDLEWPNIIHPSAVIASNAVFGMGVFAMAGTIFNSNVQIGNFANFFTNCNVEHDCVIGDFASISAGVVLGGKVQIGNYSAISLNATIFDRLNIGQNTVVGAASLVTKNLPDNVLAYGCPAKIIRERKIGEKFLN